MVSLYPTCDDNFLFTCADTVMHLWSFSNYYEHYKFYDKEDDDNDDDDESAQLLSFNKQRFLSRETHQHYSFSLETGWKRSLFVSRCRLTKKIFFLCRFVLLRF